MDQLAEKWAVLMQRIDGMQARERLIMTATVVVTVWIAAMVVFIEPLIEQRKELSADLRELKSSIATRESELKIMKIEYSVDPNKKPRTRLRELTHQLRRIERDIESKSQHLVPTRKTAQVLREILNNQSELYLTRFEKLAPIAVSIGVEKDETSMASDVAKVADAMNTDDLAHVKVLMGAVEETDSFLKRLQSQTSIYKHGVKMHLDGSFVDVLAYLQELEKMNWKVYWNMFEYRSGEYPMGKASFVIETLGFDDGWIGA